MKRKTKLDLELEARAVRRGWHIRQSYYEKIPARMMALANNPALSPRYQIEAARTLVAMDRANLADKYIVSQGENNLVVQQRIQELINAELESTTTPDKPVEDAPRVPPELDDYGGSTSDVVETIPAAAEGPNK